MITAARTAAIGAHGLFARIALLHIAVAACCLTLSIVHKKEEGIIKKYQPTRRFTINSLTKETGSKSINDDIPCPRGSYEPDTVVPETSTCRAHAGASSDLSA